MNIKKWTLLILSALFYALPFIFSHWLWWGVFFCFVPLFLVITTTPLTFRDGFLWGILIWALHIHGILYSIFLMAQGPCIIRIFPAIFIILYQAFFVGLYFFLMAKIINWLGYDTHPFKRLALGVLATWLYFTFVVSSCLCIFNTWEGYSMMDPLLPLAEHPVILTFLPLIGKNVLLLALLITNGLLAACFLVKRTRYKVILLSASFAPWLASVVSAPPAQLAPVWVNRVVRVPFIFLDVLDLTELAQRMQKILKETIALYPKADIFIFPESSFNRINLSTAQEIAQLWDSKHLSKPVNLFIGACNWEGENYYNALYWVHDGHIKEVFKKRHAMLLLEGIAPQWDYSFVRTLYYQTTPPVKASTNPRPLFELANGVKLVPYICSELFFNDKPDDTYPDATILAVCNDIWAQLAFIKRLMYLAARFKAIEWRRDLIYTSYKYGVFIDKQGTVTPLPLQAADLKDLNRRVSK